MTASLRQRLAAICEQEYAAGHAQSVGAMRAAAFMETLASDEGAVEAMAKAEHPLLWINNEGRAAACDRVRAALAALARHVMEG